MLVLKLGNAAKKFFKRLPPKHFHQVEGKLVELCKSPFPPDSKRLKGFAYYRVDSGEYRIIYDVRGGILDVPLIGKRNDDEVYKQLKRFGS